MKQFFKKAGGILKLVGESVVFAFSQLKVDKFRTFLSLLGVSIGIFSIVAVMTVVDSIKNVINEGFEAFGSDLIMVESYPMKPEDDGVFKWWEYRKRPNITYSEFQYISNNSKTYDRIAYNISFKGSAKYRGNSFSEGDIIGVSENWDMIIRDKIDLGRGFSSHELENGTHVVVIGKQVRDKLFPNGEDPLGKIIKVGISDAIVIGVFQNTGESAVSMTNVDEVKLVPINFARTMVDLSSVDGTIVVTPREEVEKDVLSGEITSLMRSARHLQPQQKNNFAINEISYAIDTIADIFKTVNLLGWIIGGFSLLIGGFGIANIMFVSVKERTNQIGIMKALGAKKYVITLQFLIEAATLSLAGGFWGIALVYLCTLIIPVRMIKLTLTFGNIMLGSCIAIIIGIVAGVAPARAAANLNPVEAIND
ncbi:MAG: ABC transporter permease [Bacteroidales bacterium]|jgi:putative ABC transport system permease protein|nr:ABC transporter permease [Bacteroidales bacterium]MDD3201905.1 ABC transporter permease [Bacteroidales bacterium]